MDPKGGLEARSTQRNPAGKGLPTIDAKEPSALHPLRIQFAEGHEGLWHTCTHCRDAFKPELFVWYGTNEYNFEKLPNPPVFEPIHCDGCGPVVSLVMGGYSEGPEGLLCSVCSERNGLPA